MLFTRLLSCAFWGFFGPERCELKRRAGGSIHTLMVMFWEMGCGLSSHSPMSGLSLIFYNSGILLSAF